MIQGFGWVGWFRYLGVSGLEGVRGSGVWEFAAFWIEGSGI